MTIDRLREIARKWFDSSIETLRRDGDLMQQFMLVGRDETVEFIAIDGPLTNSEIFKADLGRKIRARTESGELQAVLMVSDSFFASLTPEQDKTIKRLRLNVEQAHELGLCEKREAVSVYVESPIFQGVMRQEYRRCDGDKRIELVGEPDIRSDADGTMKASKSRFSGYWSAAR